MEKIWLQHYPSDLAHEIGESPYASLVELLHGCFADYAELPAYTNMGATLSYREIFALLQAGSPKGRPPESPTWGRSASRGRM